MVDDKVAELGDNHNHGRIRTPLDQNIAPKLLDRLCNRDIFEIWTSLQKKLFNFTFYKDLPGDLLWLMIGTHGLTYQMRTESEVSTAVKILSLKNNFNLKKPPTMKTILI